MANKGRKNPRIDELLAVALARGLDIKDAAKEAGCSERTAYRRWKDQTFKSRVSEIQSEMVTRAAGELASNLTEATKTLRGLLKAKSETVQLNAAKSIIDLTTKLRETVHLEQRVAELESLLSLHKEQLAHESRKKNQSTQGRD